MTADDPPSPPEERTPNDPVTTPSGLVDTDTVRRAFDVILALKEEGGIDRSAFEHLIDTVLYEIPEEDRSRTTAVMTSRGLLPDASGRCHADELPDDKQDVLGDPDGLVMQSLRLASSVRAIGTMLGLPDDDVRNVTLAAALINTGKTKQLAGLRADADRQYESDDDRAKAMFHGYCHREQEEYEEIERLGFPPAVVALLRENVRHDPSQLQTRAGRLLYYVLHSQVPETGELVGVENRVNASLHTHPIYGPVYKGYSLHHDGADLVDVHRASVAAIEQSFAATLKMNAAPEGTLNSLLNAQVGFTPPALQEPAR